ncbi:class A sortase [Domibacillus sp. PGB-M46]|uniref:class A sortase n=1 Tax=Domibacillus sp. PGB-M46 TaxID=2910255 RepID=UPI001F57C001|nr:class A sortase [Domibacillus sp. PGB-M46]MCI2253062.1 class A sortase [Domibacillus sp. PGB-M46]
MKIRQVIGVLCILTAIVLIGAPFLKYELLEAKSSHVTAQSLTPEKIEQNNKKPAEFDMESIEPPSVMDTVVKEAKADEESVVGQIRIPAVNMDLPILKGTTNENLMAGATTMRENQWMGVGNYPLAGHHMNREDLLFSPVLKVKKGDLIYVTDLTYEYTYSVTKIEVVHESRTDVIENTIEPNITLVTCYNSDDRTKRFIVTGELKETHEYKK